MSRSEFFARAAERYMDELDTRSLTGQIDAALESLEESDGSLVDAVSAGHRVLELTEW